MRLESILRHLVIHSTCQEHLLHARHWVVPRDPRWPGARGPCPDAAQNMEGTSQAMFSGEGVGAEEGVPSLTGETEIEKRLCFEDCVGG